MMRVSHRTATGPIAWRVLGERCQIASDSVAERYGDRVGVVADGHQSGRAERARLVALFDGQRPQRRVGQARRRFIVARGF